MAWLQFLLLWLIAFGFISSLVTAVIAGGRDD